MTRALLIGCGNIGAGYDLAGGDRVWTHAKAYAQNGNIELTVFDLDEERARQVAARYRAAVMRELNEVQIGHFDIVSITTPTHSHFYYLKKCLKAKIPVVICEKPVAASVEELSELETLYRNSHTKILVNYMRRFQPGFALAKNKLMRLKDEQALKAVVIKYKRGFLNNGSHAVDLLEFIFEQPFHFRNFQCLNAVTDAFDDDPTITGGCGYLGAPVGFWGLPSVSYGLFEIELFFVSSRVLICESGNEIRYFHEVGGALTEQVTERQTGILDSYMLPVLKEALACLYNRDMRDNFIPALRLNSEMLQTIKDLKSNINATTSH